jgi:alkaline phosphatase D
MTLANARRRALLKRGLACSLALGVRTPGAAGNPRTPFTLGVASGYPVPDGFSLWTRLAPEPLARDGGMPDAPVEVHWEVSSTSDFSQRLAQGTTHAEPEHAHAVHVDVRGLPANQRCYYRFQTGDVFSPIGRSQTAPALGTSVDRLKLAVASCQHYEHGYFSAYRDMLAGDPDLVIHLGDYLYEGSWGPHKARAHSTPDPVDLDTYRRRHASYRLDPDLQAMHAATPWVLVWDDHEVENDYARDRSRYHADAAQFMARRRAAYQAWYEHMPVPERMRPTDTGLDIYTSLSWGDLAELTFLDTRQYRSYPACAPNDTRVPGWPCGRLDDPHATLLGERQTAWLEGVLTHSTQAWQIIAQSLFMARCDALPGPREKLFLQNWDGYPAAREQLLAALARKPERTPLVLSGDVHAFWVNELWRNFADRSQGILGAEIITTSLSAFGPDDSQITHILADPDAPWHRFATAQFRGYVRVELGPEAAQIDLRAVENPERVGSATRSLSRWRLDRKTRWLTSTGDISSQKPV